MKAGKWRVCAFLEEKKICKTCVCRKHLLCMSENPVPSFSMERSEGEREKERRREKGRELSKVVITNYN